MFKAFGASTRSIGVAMASIVARPYPSFPAKRSSEALVAIVCVSCERVHRVAPLDLAGVSLTCPHCGVARDATAVRSKLPAGVASAQ